MFLRVLFLISIVFLISCINDDSGTGPAPIKSTIISVDVSADYFDLVLRDDTLDVNFGFTIQDSVYFAEEAEYFFNVIYPKRKIDSVTIDYDTTDYLNGNHLTTKQIGSFSDKLPASYFYDTEYEGMVLFLSMHRKTNDTSYCMVSKLHFLALDLDS